MRLKRFFAAVLTAALLASLAALPAGAAASSFSDVGDQTTAVNADILRLMGVVSGTGSNRFDPSGVLTRAQFCTMAVNFLQKGNEARRYATQTIFSDVTSTHWARAYINYAASYTVGGSGEDASGVRLISGVGDGRFLPNRNITMGEAVTILLRALGYSGKDAGPVWPQGYMDLGASIGLTKGLSAGVYDSISRAQAAQLFVNALKCKKADGTVYYKSLGGKVESGAIILAVNVETDDGSSGGAIRTTCNKNSEAYLPAQGSGNPAALQGRRGDLVLNDRDEIVTFVPDDSTAVTITLSGNAQAGYLKASGGKQYTISGDTQVYTAAGGAGKNYSEAFSTLVSGTKVTMYTDRGKVQAIYATGGATETTSDAVVVMGDASKAAFHQLTGGVTNFTVMKNRQTIRLSDIKEYDVVTYDSLSNTLIVSDLKLSCVYGDGVPNTKAPTSVTLRGSGDQFDVLESAWSTCGDFKPGDNVVLLLTADGKVAGMAAPSGKVRSNAVGYLDGGQVEMFLPNGLTMPLKGKVSNTSLDKQLVAVSATGSGISVNYLSTIRNSGDFNVTGMKLGSYTVAAGVRVYEQVKGGAMVEVDRGDLGVSSVPGSQIAAYHLDSTDLVDYIILSDVTGNAYEYGVMVSVTESTTEKEAIKDKDGKDPDDEGWTPTYKDVINQSAHWELRRGSRETITFTASAAYSGRSGDMVGVVAGKPMSDEASGSTIKAILQLTEVKNVKGSDFFESEGVPHVNAGGRTYRIADGVECLRSIGSNIRDEASWLSGTQSERLSAIKAYGDSFTVYVDPVGGQVRVIRAN